jgi:hypothetical protein
MLTLNFTIMRRRFAESQIVAAIKSQVSQPKKYAGNLSSAMQDFISRKQSMEAWKWLM